MKKEREIDYSKTIVDERNDIILSVDNFKLDKIEIVEYRGINTKCDGCIFLVYEECVTDKSTRYCSTLFGNNRKDYIYKKQEIKIKCKKKRII